MDRERIAQIDRSGEAEVLYIVELAPRHSPRVASPPRHKSPPPQGSSQRCFVQRSPSPARGVALRRQRRIKTPALPTPRPIGSLFDSLFDSVKKTPPVGPGALEVIPVYKVPERFTDSKTRFTTCPNKSVVPSTTKCAVYDLALPRRGPTSKNPTATAAKGPVTPKASDMLLQHKQQQLLRQKLLDLRWQTSL